MNRHKELGGELLGTETARNFVAIRYLYFAILAGICATLWLIGNGSYFIKGTGESHAVYIAAANVSNPLSFLVQDMAASPEPEAHPYWYIHHPNIPAKTLSLLMIFAGLGIEAQIGSILLLNVLGLAIMASAISRFSQSGALAGLAIAATSYWSFHFNAGDLLRGTLYLLLWPLLLALIANPKLLRTRWNAVVAVVSAMAVLSDWAFAAFVLGLIFCWVVVGREAIPWRWFLLWTTFPAIAAFAIYEAAVITAVGWELFLFDANVTYLGRLGVGRFLDFRSLLDVFREHRVIVWEGAGDRAQTLFDFLVTLVLAPLKNCGPIWLLLLPVTVGAILSVFSRLGWAWRRTTLAVGLASASAAQLVPPQVLLIPWLMICFSIRHIKLESYIDRMVALVFTLFWALLLPAIIFPSYAIGFLYAAGRAPMPILEIAAGSLLAALLANKWFASDTIENLHAQPRTTNWQIVAIGFWILGYLIALAYGNQLLVKPNTDAESAAIATAFSSVALLTIAALLSSGDDERESAWVIALALTIATMIAFAYGLSRVIIGTLGLSALLALLHGWHRQRPWLNAAILAVVTSVLATYGLGKPSQVGPLLAIVLTLSSFATLAAIAMALNRRLKGSFVNRQESLLLRGITRLGLMPWTRSGWLDPAATRARAMVPAIALVLASGQLLWFGLSVASAPPRPIPYQQVLEQEKYRGKSFLSSTYDGLVWYSTRGWAYMTPVNPPDLTDISPRFRHFADWQNDKYDRPDYFLCDASPFSFVRPGYSSDKSLPVRKMDCIHCTCRDVASLLAMEGHIIEVARDDYAILRLSWRLRHPAP